MSVLDLSVPIWRDLKGVQKAENLEALTVPDQNPPALKSKIVILVPPLVQNMILESNSMVPLVLIPLLSAKFQEMDRYCPTVKACTLLRPVMEFLWAVHKKLIPSTFLAIDVSQDAGEWASHFHFACIMAPVAPGFPPPFTAPPAPNSVDPNAPFASVAGDVRLLREAAEQKLLHEAQGMNTKKDSSQGWDKLPGMVQNMILRMSAVHDDVLPIEPSESYTKILKQTKVLRVAMVMNLELYP